MLCIACSDSENKILIILDATIRRGYGRGGAGEGRDSWKGGGGGGLCNFCLDVCTCVRVFGLALRTLSPTYYNLLLFIYF